MSGSLGCLLSATLKDIIFNEIHICDWPCGSYTPHNIIIYIFAFLYYRYALIITCFAPYAICYITILHRLGVGGRYLLFTDRAAVKFPITMP